MLANATTEVESDAWRLFWNRVGQRGLQYLLDQPWFLAMLRSSLFWIVVIGIAGFMSTTYIAEKRKNAATIAEREREAAAAGQFARAQRAEAERLAKFFVEHADGSREGPLTWTQANDLAHATDGQVKKASEIQSNGKL